MKRLILVLAVLLIAPAAFAAGYTTITWYTTPVDYDNPVGEEVIPDECGTASSWGTTGNYKIVRTYDCTGWVTQEQCYRWLFGQWYPQYCY